MPSPRRSASATTSPPTSPTRCATLAAEDRLGYVLAVESVLESFETRDEYLEDVAVADTVLVLQELARRREPRRGARVAAAAADGVASPV